MNKPALAIALAMREIIKAEPGLTEPEIRAKAKCTDDLGAAAMGMLLRHRVVRIERDRHEGGGYTRRFFAETKVPNISWEPRQPKPPIKKPRRFDGLI